MASPDTDTVAFSTRSQSARSFWVKAKLHCRFVAMVTDPTLLEPKVSVGSEIFMHWSFL
jgi:hypothetical protein